MVSSEDCASNAAELLSSSNILASETQPGCEAKHDGSCAAKPSAQGGAAAPAPARPSKRFVDEDSKSPEYRSDSWRMANFKVVPCSKRYAHDWTVCPFAHPGEKARRRDPRVYSYAGIACPDMKKAGFCSRGDKCPYAHNVFEFWLHPTRYRTQLCNDGTKCTRNVCFFAHTVEEMRPLPCKPAADIKKDTDKGGAVSPDTHFMQSGASVLTSSSTASSDMWLMLSPEDRARSAGLSPDEVSSGKAGKTARQSELIDELASSLANVKLAMASEKRDEVINLLSTLLQEAAEDKRTVGSGQARPAAMATPYHNHAAELSLALSALDRSQAHSLLADTTRRDLVMKRLANTPPEASQDWQHIVQQILDVPDAPSRAQSMRPQSASTSVLTAPASLEEGMGRQGSIPICSRVLSADMGAPKQPSFWQGCLPELPQIPRAPSSHVQRNLSGDIDVSPRPMPMLDAQLFSGPKLPANPGALRKQSLNLEEHLQMPMQPPPPRREVRRPPISAFQHAASEDWKQPVGRVPTGDLRWTNSSGRMSSTDLMPIKEGLPPLMYRSTDLYHGALDGAAMNLPFTTMPAAGRSSSTGVGVEPVLNLMPAPLSFPTTQPGGRDTSALHSAPYDLDLAYRAEAERAHHPSRQSFDSRGPLQGWGGLHAQDFGSTLY